MSGAKILVLYYSTYGHNAKMAHVIADGVKSTGAAVSIKQIPETLSNEILAKMSASDLKDKDVPVIKEASELVQYDGFIFGFPTRFGMVPSQFKAFWDSTGGLWASGALRSKFFTMFTSSSNLHGGQETTHFASLPQFIHHGMIYVPMGFHQETFNSEKIHGGSAYGASVVIGSKSELQATPGDLKIAEDQGKYFANIVSAYINGKNSKH